jgi:NADH:ubiquinone oxidoreductase subunit 6 (subunit J)
MYLAHPVALGAAAVFIVAAVILYRRRGAEGEDKTGSQTAVIMLVIGVLLAIYGLGLMEYHPTPSELQR